MVAKNADSVLLTLRARAAQSAADASFSGPGLSLATNDLFHAVTELADRIRRLAGGLAPGQRVLVQMDDDLPGVLAALSVWDAGMIPVLVGTDVRDTTLAELAREFGARLILRPGDPPLLTRSGISDNEEENSRLDVATPLSEIAVIFLTSGSTGTQKGVVISHAAMVSAIDALLAYLPLASSQLIVTGLRLDFDYGFYQPLLGLASGSRTHVIGHLPVRRRALAEALDISSNVVLPIVPSFVPVLDVWLKTPSANVKIVTSTGSPLRPQHIATLNRLFPNAVVYSMYGLTECKRALYLDPSLVDKYPEYVGKAIPGLRVGYFSEDGDVVEPTQSSRGELVVAGPTLASEYWNDPLATAYRFPQSTDGKRVLRTGDLFEYDRVAGYRFLGRYDDIVKVRDRRLSLTEVEAGILRLDAVREVVAGVQEGVLTVEAVAPSVPSSQELMALIHKEVDRRLWPDVVHSVSSLQTNRRGKPVRPGNAAS